MTCSKPICERPCERKCPREDSIYKTEFYRARLKGKIAGPLEWHHDAWRRLVEKDPSGGWPSGAVACGASAECRNAEPDAVIGLADGSASLPT